MPAPRAGWLRRANPRGRAQLDLGRSVVHLNEATHTHCAPRVATLWAAEPRSVRSPDDDREPSRVWIVDAHVQEGRLAIARSGEVCARNGSLDGHDAADVLSRVLPAHCAGTRNRALTDSCTRRRGRHKHDCCDKARKYEPPRHTPPFGGLQTPPAPSWHRGLDPALHPSAAGWVRS